LGDSVQDHGSHPEDSLAFFFLSFFLFYYSNVFCVPSKRKEKKIESDILSLVQGLTFPKRTF